ncbi:MAG TPA: multiheme c-type cytochrome [Candidatus Saccharimonadales bacterium]|nr:multiheme c-type cytochrome [Candidatus Saccharimonadales bacterium]
MSVPMTVPAFHGARCHAISLALVVCLVALASLAQERPAAKPRPAAAGVRDGYVGDGSCAPCHETIAGTYEHTAHHRTSQLADRGSILGDFSEGANILKTRDRDLFFKMEAKGGSFYQTAFFFQPPDQMKTSERFALVIGSGGKGQTYLYWKGDRLFELPVSYWTTIRSWVNSPGYTDGTADFKRPVPPRCLECHAGYLQSLPGPAPKNRYNKTGFALGISCERCHGPGSQHVLEQHSQAPPSPSHAIINPAALPRERQIEVCAQCHGGIGEGITGAFTYSAGEPLADFIKLHPPDPDAKVDVHGNQVALLARSRCYQSSQNMTCTTCHDLHAPERAASAYSVKCLACHKPENCGLFPAAGASLAGNCVDCHMPVQESDLITSTVDGQEIKDRVRNHWIKVYPQSSRPTPD